MKNLLKGMGTTARTLTGRAHTLQYPHTEPDLPDRSRGVIALLADNCTSCMLCARECPDWCIYIDSHKETLEPTVEGGRARTHNVLDRFDIDFSLCMYCGICIEVCPFDALFWAPDFAYAEGDIRNLLHDKDKLGDWMPTVPASAVPDDVQPGTSGRLGATTRIAATGTPSATGATTATPSTPGATAADAEANE